MAALQQTQIQQGRTLECMSAVQDSLSTKMDQLVSLQHNNSDAKNRMVAGQSHK